MNAPDPRRQNILGVPISIINSADCLAAIADWIRSDARKYICVADAHAVIAARDDEKLQSVYGRAGIITPDGMPLVWMCRWFGHRRVTRVYGPDLMQAVMEDPFLRGRRHFLYGGHEGVADRLAEHLCRQYPGLVIAGTHCPPFVPYNEEEGKRVAAEINAAGAEIVWIGLGAPKQEWWMDRFRPMLNAQVLIGVGAAFDFLSGTKPQAPKWMRNAGFEWLFRWVSEPRRLTRRYVKTIPRFIFLALAQILYLRQFPLPRR